MENATKALLIAGGILIAMLVISLGVLIFMNYREVGTAFVLRISTTQIRKFNSNFTKFEGREDITIQEIISLANFVKDYNEKNNANIIVKIREIAGANLADISQDSAQKIKMMEENKDNKYIVNLIKTGNDGLVTEIYFQKM